jgi:hypothetical protein
MRVVIFAVCATATVATAAACGGGGPGEAGAPPVTVTVVQTETVGAEPPAESEAVDTGAADTGVVEPVATEPPAVEASEATVVQTGGGVAQDDQGNVSYGAELVNESDTHDAVALTLTVNILGEGNAILAADSQTFNVVPAGETVYLGGEVTVAKRETATGVETIVDVGSSAEAMYPLPTVQNLRYESDEYGGGTVRGEIVNDLESPLSDFARINVALFGEGGEIVGGGYGFLDAPLPPGRRTAFDIFIVAPPTVPVTDVKGSMDNEITE